MLSTYNSGRGFTKILKIAPEPEDSLGRKINRPPIVHLHNHPSSFFGVVGAKLKANEGGEDERKYSHYCSRKSIQLIYPIVRFSFGISLLGIVCGFVWFGIDIGLSGYGGGRLAITVLCSILAILTLLWSTRLWSGDY